jgi:hypothetical protein
MVENLLPVNSSLLLDFYDTVTVATDFDFWRKFGFYFSNRNEAILEELHVTPLDEKLSTCRHNWFQHVHRMEDNRLAKQLLNYHPKGRRRPGRPLKRLLDDMTAETETGHPGLNS